jgi:aromatic-ring opening dioxygenase LigAB LigA subunit
MSAYAINKVCHLSERDARVREALRADPEAALNGFKLTPDERQALLAGDVARLFQMGGHPFLMQHLARHGLFGLNRDLYRQRIVSLNERSAP